MATLGQTQYYKTNVNGSDQYVTVPYGGNAPYGYTPISQGEYLSGLQSKIDKATALSKQYSNIVKYGGGGQVAQDANGNTYVGSDMLDANTIAGIQKQISDINAGTGVYAPGYVDPSFSKFKPDAPTPSEQYYTDAYRATLPPAEQQRLNTLYGQSNPIIDNTPAGKKQIKIGNTYGYADLNTPTTGAPQNSNQVLATSASVDLAAPITSNIQTLSPIGGSLSINSGDTVSVKALQTFLNSQGANISVDGKFGPQTQAAVRAYQSANGLKVDGIVGSQTLSSINKSTATTAPSSSTVPYSTTDASGNVIYNTGNPALDQALQSLQSYVQTNLTQGNKVNPALQITPDLVSQFLSEAHSQIDPEGQQNLTSAIADVNSSLSNLSTQYQNATAEQQANFEQNLATERNNAGNNGTAFSGARGLAENYMLGSQNRTLASLGSSYGNQIGNVLRAGGNTVGTNSLGLNGTNANFNVPSLSVASSTLEGARGGVGAGGPALSYNYDPSIYKVGSVPQAYGTALTGSANQFLNSYLQSASNNSRTFQDLNGTPTLA